MEKHIPQTLNALLSARFACDPEVMKEQIFEPRRTVFCTLRLPS